MEKTKFSRKAQLKSGFYHLKSACIAFVETLWAIMTSFAAGVVTHSIYAKGAPPTSWAPFFLVGITKTNFAICPISPRSAIPSNRSSGALGQVGRIP